MVKRALLAGCNYPRTRNELHGCVNDVTNMRKVLTSIYGFDNKDIVFMVDTDPRSIKPTGRNIASYLGKMIETSKPGDAIYFHFSGHGGQIPAESGDVEDDGADECIYPTDMNPMTDDTFRVILSKLAPGVNFTFVSDSCNSGGLLDSQELQVGIGEMGQAGTETESTRQGSPSSQEIKARELPVESLIQHLSEVSGHEVKLGTIRLTLYELFKEDVSPTVKVFVKNMTNRLEEGIPEEEWANTYNEVGVDALKQLKQVWDDETIDNDEYFQSAKAVSGPLNFSGHANAKPEGETLPPSTGILLSGCQSDQTSADAYGPPPYGALSNAVETVIRKYRGKVSNKQLANEVREIMVKTGMEQRPCLYCNKEKVNANFVYDL